MSWFHRTSTTQEQETEVETGDTFYCIGQCTCGRDCHNNAKLHGQHTGAPTCDEYYAGATGSLFSDDVDVDDDLYERAMALLMGGK